MEACVKFSKASSFRRFKPAILRNARKPSGSHTGEGGTITLVNERPIVRDSKGRIYQERWALVPKYGKVKSQKMVIQIADPNQHTLYSCAPYQHICELETYDPTHALAAPEPRKPIPNGTLVQDHLTVEDLGTRRIAGVDTVGRRIEHH
jgi:hypothetical protein